MPDGVAAVAAPGGTRATVVDNVFTLAAALDPAEIIWLDADGREVAR